MRTSDRESKQNLSMCCQDLSVGARFSVITKLKNCVKISQWLPAIFTKGSFFISYEQSS